MTRITHNLVQGSADWKDYRLTMRGASESAAALGISSKVSRTELLHMKHTCTAQEFSDWVQANIMDYGHEVEALARPLAEDILGTELYPVTCSIGKLSASCDGLTMGEDVAWEHKQWNEALAAAVGEGVLPDEYQPQCQQIMMITGAETVLFMVSDGTLDNMVTMYVHPSQEWQDRIVAGWAQFDADLAVYEPKEYAPKPKAAPILRLPALAVQIRGEVTVSNLPVFQAKAEAFIASINMELKTDEDFVNADATVKFCAETEKNLELAKAAAIAQTSSIDELMRTVDHISAQIREKRLFLEKLVTTQKQAIKDAAILGAKTAFDAHVADLNKELAPLWLVFQARDFAGAAKNKRTLATLQNAVDTELANSKITVDAIAKAVRGRLTWYNTTATDHTFLFADLQTVIQKPDDDFKLAVNSRIDAHKAKVAAELKAAQAKPEGADLSPAAQALNETEGAQRFAASHPTLQGKPLATAWPLRTEDKPNAAPTTPPTLRLGQIADRLGFALTADFLRTLGFEAAARDKAAVLYHESAFPQICASLINHIAAIGNPVAAAA